MPIAGAQIGFELLLQHFAATMDKRFCGGKRAAQNFGDFLVAQILLPAEQNGGALVFRQFSQCFLDFLRQLAVQQCFCRQKNFFVLVLPLWLALAFTVGFFERFGGMTRAAAQFVQAKVARDGEQPRGKFCRPFVAAPGFVNLEKNILREILGFGLIAQCAINEVHHRLPVFFHQLRKRRAVAPFDTEHQGGIRIERDWHCARGV